MTLKLADGQIEGSSGPLDEAQFFPLTVKGKGRGDSADLDVVARNQVAGQLSVVCKAEKLSGKGVLYGTPVTISAVRPPQPTRAPITHDYTPTSFALQYTSNIEPVLRVIPGDSVRTTTLDNEGQDQALQWKGMPGNTLTGPIYVEGAMPGDTLVVHLKRVSLNRDTAKMSSNALGPKAVGGYPQMPAPGWDRTWVLDREKGVAQLKTPGNRLAGLKVPLKPMLGSIGVAAPLNQAIYAGDLGFHGGNLDYNRLTAGTTVYLPVWRGGAFLFLGDGHALQGDGEISGQGLETSIDVEFTVELIKGKTLGQVWFENADDVMVSGIENSLDTSLQMATAGMSRWLKDNYGLNDSEVAALLSSSIAYDIAEVVDPRPHVVARIAKKTLAMIQNP
jgi:acetamidase/formamidase